MSRRNLLIPSVVCFILIPAMAFANVYGAVRGVVHDPKHRPIQRRYGDAQSQTVVLGKKRDYRCQR